MVLNDGDHPGSGLRDVGRFGGYGLTLGVAIALFAFFLGMGVEPGWWCDAFLWLCVGLLIVTTVRRVRRAAWPRRG